MESDGPKFGPDILYSSMSEKGWNMVCLPQIPAVYVIKHLYGEILKT